LIWQNIASERNPATISMPPALSTDTEKSVVIEIIKHHHYTPTRVQWT